MQDWTITAIMEQMVEHLIVAHSCKTLNYVGGPAESQENLLLSAGL